MRRGMVSVLLAGLLVCPVLAVRGQDEGKKGEGGDKQKRENADKREGRDRERRGGAWGGQPVTSEVTVSGRIEKKQLDRDGKTQTVYFLVDAEGHRIMLGGQGDRGRIELPEGINLDDYLDVEVKITGQSAIRFTKVTRLEKTGGAAAAKAGEAAKPAEKPAEKPKEGGGGAGGKEGAPAVW